MFRFLPSIDEVRNGVVEDVLNDERCRYLELSVRFLSTASIDAD